VDWPREDALRQQLAAARRPRVLLVEPDQPPPLSGDGLEDWVRLPVDPEELRIRIATVASRAGAERWHAAGYVLDDQGVLRAGTEWAAFPPIEARLLARLLDRAGHVVHRDELARVVWPDGPRSIRVRWTAWSSGSGAAPRRSVSASTRSPGAVSCWSGRGR
jgi:two-component system, OmpR family, response regulator